MNKIVLRVPFVFSETIDSKSIATVGDYVILENALSPMAVATHNKGVTGIFTEVAFTDPTTLLIGPKDLELNQKSDAVSNKKVIEAVTKLFTDIAGKGSTHIRWSSSIDSIQIVSTGVQVKFKHRPVNLFHSLALMDLAFADGPVVRQGKPSAATSVIPGPYLLKEWSPRLIRLEIDTRFPSSSRANVVKDVDIEYRRPGEIGSKDTDSANKGQAIVEYIYGHEISNDQLKAILNAKENNLLIRPNEWMVYLGFRKDTPAGIRRYIKNHRVAMHSALLNQVPGQAAFGIQPSDRQGALRQESKRLYQKRPLELPEITTLDEWMDFPAWKILTSSLKREGFRFRTLPRTQFKEIFKSPVYLSMLGFSAADPVAHLELLSGAGRIAESTISRSELDSMIRASDASEAARINLQFENRLSQSIDIVPVWHFPSVILEDARLQRSASLWNEAGCLQAWAYQVSN